MTDHDSWWSLTLQPLPESREQLEALLYAAGCTGIWEREEAGPAAGRAGLTVYFPGPPPADPAALEWWAGVAALSADRPRCEKVEKRDWFKEWRKNFSPTPLTERTLVIPAWMEPENGEYSLVLKIYPGQGFGTGTHETTRLAARLLESELEKKTRSGGAPSLLDIGTGSGILAILAARRGAGRVTALDIDPDALENARENLQHNGVERFVELSHRPLAAENESHDIVVANIIAPVLEELASHFPRVLKPGGSLILSGMLREQVEKISRRCSGLGLVCSLRHDLGEWSALVWQKPG